MDDICEGIQELRMGKQTMSQQNEEMSLMLTRTPRPGSSSEKRQHPSFNQMKSDANPPNAHSPNTTSAADNRQHDRDTEATAREREREETRIATDKATRERERADKAEANARAQQRKHDEYQRNMVAKTAQLRKELADKAREVDRQKHGSTTKGGPELSNMNSRDRSDHNKSSSSRGSNDKHGSGDYKSNSSKTPRDHRDKQRKNADDNRHNEICIDHFTKGCTKPKCPRSHHPDDKRVCAKFRANICTNGKECTFDHTWPGESPSESRSSGYAGYKAKMAAQGSGTTPINRNCMKHLEGKCTYDVCNFYHAAPHAEVDCGLSACDKTKCKYRHR
jgi:hypothetical protein